MTIYRVSVGSREYQVEVAGNRLSINGEQIQANLTALNELGLYLLRRDDRQRELHVSNRGGNTYTAVAEGRHLVAQVERDDVRGQRKQASAGHGDVKSPMPGVVVKVLVQEGTAVEKGEAVVVMESMKMQMELRATVGGIVSSVCVQPGARVEKGAVLVKVTV